MPTRDIFYGCQGPRDAQIMIVGEAWGFAEDLARRKFLEKGLPHDEFFPFHGSSGQEFTRILADGGIPRGRCLLTNVICARPPNNDIWHYFNARDSATATLTKLWGLHPTPDCREHIVRLFKAIAVIKPKVVIAAGNYALWALTTAARVRYGGKYASKRMIPVGVGDYRGSLLYLRDPREDFPELPQDFDYPSVKVLPIFHPAAILRQWTFRQPTIHDLRNRVPQALKDDWRAAPLRIKTFDPSYNHACQLLTELLWHLDHTPQGLDLACDIETKARLITCIGFCYQPARAFTIPLMKVEQVEGKPKFSSFYTIREEMKVIHFLYRIFTHPNARFIGQNFHYDMYYIWEQYGWDFTCAYDLMSLSNLCFPGTPKNLGHLSSLYYDYHVYWKDDNKEWDGKSSADDHYKYNCEDALRTWHIKQQLIKVCKVFDRLHLLPERMALHATTFRMMRRGILIDQVRHRKVTLDMQHAIRVRETWLEKMIPQEWIPTSGKSKWHSSPTQLQYVFYDLLGMGVRKNRKTGNPTTDSDAIAALMKKYPFFTRLFSTLLELRSARVFLNTFLMAPLSHDGRLRTSLNMDIPETFRFSSSSNPYNEGTNLQNIPEGDEG